MPPPLPSTRSSRTHRPVPVLPLSLLWPPPSRGAGRAFASERAAICRAPPSRVGRCLGGECRGLVAWQEGRGEGRGRGRAGAAERIVVERGEAGVGWDLGGCCGQVEELGCCGAWGNGRSMLLRFRTERACEHVIAGRTSRKLLRAACIPHHYTGYSLLPRAQETALSGRAQPSEAGVSYHIVAAHHIPLLSCLSWQAPHRRSPNPPRRKDARCKNTGVRSTRWVSRSSMPPQYACRDPSPTQENEKGKKEQGTKDSETPRCPTPRVIPDANPEAKPQPQSSLVRKRRRHPAVS